MKKILYLLILTISISIYSQDFTGKVVDKKSLYPIPEFKLKVQDSDKTYTTDIEGKFYIDETQTFPVVLVVATDEYKKQVITITKPNENLIVKVEPKENTLEVVIVTSRRKSEQSQKVPIPITVLGGGKLDETGGYNVNKLKELVPSVQLYSSNPRNTTLNIRGLGSTFGLTNDGIEPGVGFYIDGVYYSRPAATTMDFIDMERVEVLRGPQGTLYGKNTTSGAFNIVSKKPNFVFGSNAELSFGNYNFIQAKTSINGKLFNRLAARLSFTGTKRDGTIYNQRADQFINTQNNLGAKLQLLYTPSSKSDFLLTGDFTRQRPIGYAQVVAGVAPTLRTPYRQFANIIKDLGYTLPSTNAFDRTIDTDTPWKSNNDVGGISLNYDQKFSKGTLTSISAWRYWNWDPSSDRDFTGLAVLTKSAAQSKHNQFSEEIRYTGDLSENVSGTFGIFGILQDLKTNQVEKVGSDQWRFASTNAGDVWTTDHNFATGYRAQTNSTLKTKTLAAFGQIDWKLNSQIQILPGLRYNYDEKDAVYNRTTSGGNAVNAAQAAALKTLYTDQSYATNISSRNFSGQLTVTYKFAERANFYTTYSRSYKPVGVNIGGLPTANGQTLYDLAEVKPEKVTHYEIGIKTNPTLNSKVNVTFFNTEITDYQTQVQTPEVGVNRGYLANAEAVNVKGAELDASWNILKSLSLSGSLSYTDGKYVSFKNAPVPIEETGGASAFKDISGQVLPGISKWAGSASAEYSKEGRLFNNDGSFFFAIDGFARSTFSSSSSYSAYLNIAGYALFNSRIGFRASKGISAFLWIKNAFNKNYYEQLLVASGNAGQYAAVVGDPRTFGITIRYVIK